MTGKPNSETYESITRGIHVQVQPEYLPDQSDADTGRYVWAYHVRVRNDREETVQLRTRTWHITDGNGGTQEVKGSGVVGEQPILNSGDEFRYSSGCPLGTSSGFMVGSYTMVRPNGETFEVAIPAFSLELPNARQSLN